MSPNPSSPESNETKSSPNDVRWVAIFLLVLGSVTFAIQNFVGWRAVRVPVMPLTFSDLRAVTHDVDCLLRDPAWSVYSATCDPYDRPNNYPGIWVHGFAAFGLTSAHTNQVGYLLEFLYVAAASACLWLVGIGRHQARFTAAALIVSLSPPVLLMMERGNVDAFLFALVVLGLLLYALDHKSVAMSALAMAAVLKVYPVGAALLPLSNSRRSPRQLLAYAGCMLVGLPLVWNDLGQVLRGTPLPFSVSFGDAVIVGTIGSRGSGSGLLSNAAVQRSLGGTVLVLSVAGIALWSGWHRRTANALDALVSEIAGDERLSAVFLAAVGVVSVSYAVGASFDYRLVFAVPIVFVLLKVENCGRTLPTLLASSWIFVLLVSGSTWRIQFAGDIVLLLLLPATIVAAIAVLRRRLVRV